LLKVMGTWLSMKLTGQNSAVMRIINRRRYVPFGVELAFVALFYFAVVMFNG